VKIAAAALSSQFGAKGKREKIWAPKGKRGEKKKMDGENGSDPRDLFVLLCSPGNKREEEGEVFARKGGRAAVGST